MTSSRTRRQVSVNDEGAADAIVAMDVISREIVAHYLVREGSSCGEIIRLLQAAARSAMVEAPKKESRSE